MKSHLKLQTFKIGTPAKKSQGLRIGTTRRPPRGVPRSRWQSGGYFDVWLPILAPSAKLLNRFEPDNIGNIDRFFAAYEREMQRAEARQTIELISRLAITMPIAIGCFCDDESRCHRSRLRRLIDDAASR